MTAQNVDYYRQRADEESAAAERAGDPAIAEIHREMAQLYRDLLSQEIGQLGGQLEQPPGGALDEPRIQFG